MISPQPSQSGWKRTKGGSRLTAGIPIEEWAESTHSGFVSLRSFPEYHRFIRRQKDLTTMHVGALTQRSLS